MISYGNSFAEKIIYSKEPSVGFQKYVHKSFDTLLFGFLHLSLGWT